MFALVKEDDLINGENFYNFFLDGFYVYAVLFLVQNVL